jgi:hypothetical protein
MRIYYNTYHRFLFDSRWCNWFFPRIWKSVGKSLVFLNSDLELAPYIVAKKIHIISHQTYSMIHTNVCYKQLHIQIFNHFINSAKKWLSRCKKELQSKCIIAIVAFQNIKKNTKPKRKKEKSVKKVFSFAYFFNS